MTFFFYVVCGVIAGAGLASIVWMLLCEKWFIGDLREDQSIPDDPPFYFMEIRQGCYEYLKKGKFVLLRVRRENYMKSGDAGK